MPTLIELTCDYCSQTFQREKKQIKKNRPNKFCSRTCGAAFSRKRVTQECKNCGTEFKKKPADPKIFCDSSCSASWNNKHKEYGHKVSRFEVWLQDMISESFPNLRVKYNQKDDIGSELDVYIPSLKLAIEIDGIHHHEAIYGEDVLKSIQENDAEKRRVCDQKGIELINYDISDMKNMKQNLSGRIEEILNIISEKLES